MTRPVAVTALILAIVFILAVNPVGFMGGAWDDWQYLNAARCWVEYGPCLPNDHWQGRWPVIAPLASSIALLGETRFSIGLPFAVILLAILWLVAKVGDRAAGTPVGWMTALFFVCIPYVAIQFVQPNVEFPELLCLLATAALLVGYRDRPSPWLAVLAGLAFGLAMQARETAIIGLPLLVFAGWKISRGNLLHLALAALGTALPFIVEFIAFGAITGDPFYRRGLSLAHTTIPSTELRGEVSAGGSPFFNVDLIANWRHDPGFKVHWAIDGLFNLLTNAKAGLAIFFSIVLLPVAWGALQAPEKRLIKVAAAIGLYWAVMLIYVFAIDPKPRMMFVPLLAASFILAILLRATARRGFRLLAGLVTAMTVISGLAISAMQQELWSEDAKVEALLERYPGQIEIDENSRRHLALVEGIESLPDLEADRPLLLIKIDTSCTIWREGFLRRDVDILAELRMTILDEHLIGTGGTVCLLRYGEPISSEHVLAAKSPPAVDRDPFRVVRVLTGREE